MFRAARVTPIHEREWSLKDIFIFIYYYYYNLLFIIYLILFWAYLYLSQSTEKHHLRSFWNLIFFTIKKIAVYASRLFLDLFFSKIKFIRCVFIVLSISNTIIKNIQFYHLSCSMGSEFAMRVWDQSCKIFFIWNSIEQFLLILLIHVHQKKKNNEQNERAHNDSQK